MCDLIRSYTLPASANLDSGKYEEARADVVALLALKIDEARCSLADYNNTGDLLHETYLRPARVINAQIEPLDLDTKRSRADSLVKDLTTARASLEALIALDQPAKPGTCGTPQPAYKDSYEQLRQTLYLLATVHLASPDRLPEARNALLDLINVDCHDPQNMAYRGKVTLIGQAFSTPAFNLSQQQPPDWQGIVVLLEPLYKVDIQRYIGHGYLDKPTAGLLADAYYQLALALSQDAINS